MKTGNLFPSLRATLRRASDAGTIAALRTFLCLAFVFTAGASAAQEQDNRPAPEDPRQIASPGQFEQAGPG